MRLQDLNWMDVERYLQTDNRIIMIIGATEQHAYLSLMTDILIPSRIALAVAEREPVLIAPPLSFGVSAFFSEFPGTITLSRPLFDAVLGEMIEGLMHQGFERFFILNGHSGNQISQQLRDLHRANSVQIDWYDWWQGEAAQQFQAEYQLQIEHANWGENFPFTRVTDTPDEEKPPINLELLDVGQTVREVLGDGNYGGLYQVADELTQVLFTRIVDEATERLRALRNL